MLFHLLPERLHDARNIFVQRRNIHWGRRGWRGQNVLENIPATQNDGRARGIARDGKDAGLAQNAAALACGKLHTPEVHSLDSLDSVKAGELLI